MRMPEPLPSLPDIDDVEPVSEKDTPCIQAVRDVLAQYGALQRFGLTLLHGHFDVGDDEILMEFVDKRNRTMTIRPVEETEHDPEKSIETSWRLDTPTGMQCCERHCMRPYGPNGPHITQHIPVG